MTIRRGIAIAVAVSGAIGAVLFFRAENFIGFNFSMMTLAIGCLWSTYRWL